MPPLEARFGAKVDRSAGTTCGRALRRPDAADLARARESTPPLDAAEGYEREVSAQIDRKRNDAYRSAVEVMARIRRLAAAAGEPKRFHTVLTRVSTEHRAKRNLKALLDEKQW